MNEKKERKKSYSRAGDIGEKNRSEVTPGDHYHRDAQHLLMLFWLLLLFILLLLLLSFLLSIQLSTEKRVHYYSFRSHYFVFRHFVILRNNADDSYWSEIRRSPPSARLPCYKMCRPASPMMSSSFKPTTLHHGEHYNIFMFYYHHHEHIHL